MKLLYILIISISVIYSTSISAESDEMPSVWAWEINTKNRKIYILGELHYFIQQKSNVLNISHNFGDKILSKSSEVWIEELQVPPKSESGERNLSKQISTIIWNSIRDGFKRATDNMKNLDSEAKDNLLKSYITDLDRQDPITASLSLENFANANMLRPKSNYIYLPGLKYSSLNKNDNIFNNKIKKLESAQSSYESWWNNCNSKEMAEILIKNAVAKQDEKKILFNEIDLLVQDIFFRKDANVNLFIDTLMNDEIEKIHLECIGIPRTKLWIPTIIDKLSTKGEPITVLVGISHIGGENGLLTLLKKNGFTDIKRIYVID